MLRFLKCQGLTRAAEAQDAAPDEPTIRSLLEDAAAAVGDIPMDSVDTADAGLLRLGVRHVWQ